MHADTKVDPSRIQVVVATDCGSTTTKAILIERKDGVFRQTHRGEAPTTVEEPLADVTLGVTNAVTELQELSGRRLVNADGTIIRRTSPDDPNGCDIYVSTSSAGGGLQMMVAGVVREMTAESAKRAALGAGAIVMDTIA
ncbi:MAG: glutamate mutase L, partial [Planctomycetota bacterium]